MSEVHSAAVEIYHRFIDCHELDHVLGSSSSIHNNGSDDPFQMDHDVTNRPSHTHTSQTTMQPQFVQVKLELGHHATLRLKPTFEGYTHDWEVFLRSPEGASNCQIHHFVKRVEFHLHQSFSRQKIVQKEPPFKLNESGYAGFLFPIDVYFRNPGYPKKIRFLYDLTLDRRRSTIHIRCEKLTFRNPPDLFRSLLIKGGGQLVRRRHRLNDSGIVGSTLSRIIDVKPSLQSSGIEPDLSSTEQVVDSKDWFKVKQEVPETPRQLNQDKENQPQQGSVVQSKTSISFLQDWLRNIRSSKLANKRQGSLEIGFDPCGGGAVTSTELERTSFSSGIFSADSWISEGKGPRGGGAGGSDFWISEGRRATGGGVSVLDSCVQYRRVARSGFGDGFGGKGRGGERRGLREMKQVNGNWDSPTTVSSITRPFTIKLKRADMRNETSSSSSHVVEPNLSGKGSSRRGRGRPPTKHVSATVSAPSLYTHHPPAMLPPPPEDQTSTTTSKTFKTKADVLNSIIRRRLLKVKEVKDQVVQAPVQPVQTQRPSGHSTSVAGIRLKISHSLMPQTLKKSPIASEVLTPVPVQRRGRGRPRKNPLLPPPEKPDPGKRKRGRPPRVAPGVRTRNSGNSLGNPQGSDMGNSKRHLQTVGAPKSSSSDDDVVFVGYSPPKQEPQNDAEYGILSQVSVNASKSSSHTRPPRSVGRPRKIGRKRSTQLELLKSATEEFVGTAGGSGSQAEEERVRSDSTSAFTGQPRGKGKRKIGGVYQRASNFAVRLPSPQERREDDWMDRNHPRRKKLRIVPVRCGSDNEDDEDTGVSDLSVDYPSNIQSNLPLRSSNFVNELEKPGRGSKGTVLNPKKSTHTWMTSTPMKPKPPPPPPVRQRSVTHGGQTAKKRRNKEDVAWNRSGKNLKPAKQRGRPRKVPLAATTTTTNRKSSDLESPAPPVPYNNNPSASPEVATASGESVSVLMELQQRLATLADGQLLKRVVQIVEESGLYQLDDAMFDFDLCNLDRPTIEKLKVCLR